MKEIILAPLNTVSTDLSFTIKLTVELQHTATVLAECRVRGEAVGWEVSWAREGAWKEAKT